MRLPQWLAMILDDFVFVNTQGYVTILATSMDLSEDIDQWGYRERGGRPYLGLKGRRDCLLVYFCPYVQAFV